MNKEKRLAFDLIEIFIEQHEYITDILNAKISTLVEKSIMFIESEVFVVSKTNTMSFNKNEKQNFVCCGVKIGGL